MKLLDRIKRGNSLCVKDFVRIWRSLDLECKQTKLPFKYQVQMFDQYVRELEAEFHLVN